MIPSCNMMKQQFRGTEHTFPASDTRTPSHKTCTNAALCRYLEIGDESKARMDLGVTWEHQHTKRRKARYTNDRLQAVPPVHTV